MIPAIAATLHALVYKGIDNENTPVEDKKMILSDIRLLRRPLHECVIEIERTLYKEAVSYCTYGVTYQLSSRIKALLKRGVGTEVLSMKFKPDLKRKLTKINGDLNQSINFLKPMTSTSDNNDISITTTHASHVKEGIRSGIESNSTFSPPQPKRKTPIKSRPDNRLFTVADYVSSTMTRVKNKIIRASLTHEMNDDSIRLGGFNNYSTAMSLIKVIDIQTRDDGAIDTNNNNNSDSNGNTANPTNDYNNGIDKNQNDDNGKGERENNNSNNINNYINDNDTSTATTVAAAAVVEEAAGGMQTVSASKGSMNTIRSPSNFNTAPTSTPTPSTPIISNTPKNSPPTDTLQALNSTGDCYSQLTQYRWQEDFIVNKPNGNRKIKFRVLIRDSIPIILRSFLGDDGMSEGKIIQSFGDHIHNLEYCLFMQARSKKEYAAIDTLRDRVLDLLKKIDLYLYPNETVES